MTWYETAQTIIAAATLPVTAVFLALFGRPSERWWATWFGRSLFLLALGVFCYSAATVLYRTLGDYPLRPGLLITATTMVFAAMSIRTVVLWQTQRRGRRLATLPDALLLLDVMRDLDDTVHRIEHLDPCPNPDCMAFRVELIAMAHRLPTHRHEH